MPVSTCQTILDGGINEVKQLKVIAGAPKVVPHHDIIDVKSLDDLEQAMDRLTAAYQEFSSFTQAKVDSIVEAAADHFVKRAQELGQQAHDETGMGKPGDKLGKNMFAVDYVRRWYRGTKTCGIISRDEENDVDVIASPMGVVAAIVPTTNPTSTVAFKALLTLKTRNAIIVAPHPRAKKCSFDALQIIIEGAVAAGAPKDIAACISEPSIELSGTLMKHEKTSLVLATGGPAMVKAAYSSGHPAVGVGPGNVPVVVDEFANLKDVALNVVASKNFDYGVICSSEQVVIANEAIYDDLKKEFISEGAHFLTEDQKEKVGSLLFKNGGALNADVVGQSPTKIAAMAGIEVPSTTTLLVGEFDVVATSPFAKEKLSPVLGFTKRKNVGELFETAVEVLGLGGKGHTACYYTNKHTQKGRIRVYAETVVVTRCLINQPTAPGGIGGVYNFGIAPSMTLGCGSYGGNYVSDNVGPMHLLNYKRVSKVAHDHKIVMKNIDCLVPPHIATRTAMELLILTITLVAKDVTILEPFAELVSVYERCTNFLRGNGSLKELREAILYFEQYDLFQQGHNELALESICVEFNIPGGNLYPILYPQVAHKFEHVDWSNLKVLSPSLKGLEDALKLIKELQCGAGMLTEITKSSAARIQRGGVAIISDVVAARMKK